MNERIERRMINRRNKENTKSLEWKEKERMKR